MTLNLSDYAGQYVDEPAAQGRSHTAKCVLYYCSTPAVNQLVEDFGEFLQDVSPQQKTLMGAALFDHLGGASPHYGIRESLHCIDPDALLEEDLTDFVEAFATDASRQDIAQFLVAIAALVVDDIRNGEL